MKVLFFTQSDEICAASRTRVYQYLPFLHSQGIKYKVIPMVRGMIYKGALVFPEKRIRKIVYILFSLVLNYIKAFRVMVLAGDFDVVFIQRILLPKIIVYFLKKNNSNIVFDFDDAIYAPECPKANLINRLKLNRNRKFLPYLLSISKAVIVENEYNRGYAKRFAKEVHIITGPIDTHRYRPNDEISPQGLKDSIVIGWIGSATTTAYLNPLNNVFKILSSRYKFILKLIGAGDFDIPGIKIIKKKWDLNTEVSELQSFDIGIMSLPDDEWTRGKGGYKILQYLALGIPVVGSPVGINSEIIQNGINGFLADSEEEWLEKLSILIENKELRDRLGKNGRISVEERFSVNANAPKFLKIIQKASLRIRG